jgi:cell growth-regulating nucleolar protein
VKKPKLAHHYAQCRKSFTCIDCSKTFKDPTEWKSHTSCVSEAEKYQKSLYTGPKQGRQTNPTPKTMNAPGKYHQSSGTQSAWSRHQYTRNCASGANSTPLGSPLRMSSVDSLVVEPPLSSAKAASATESGKDKKRDSGAVVVCLFIHQTALA